MFYCTVQIYVQATENKYFFELMYIFSRNFLIQQSVFSLIQCYFTMLQCYLIVQIDTR